MRHDLIKDFEQRAGAARDMAAHEEVFAEAKVLLNLAEYTALLSRLWPPLQLALKQKRGNFSRAFR